MPKKLLYFVDKLDVPQALSNDPWAKITKGSILNLSPAFLAYG
jgi:hypothetical protein